VPTEVHHADLLFLPHDKVGPRKCTYKYALTVVDVASRFKATKPFATREPKKVADALGNIYRRGPLKWPKLLQVDPGREFMGAVSQLLAKHNVEVRRGRADLHRDQGIVERFNQTLVERLFGRQYAQEIRVSSGERSSECVFRLPAVVAAWNGEVTQLTSKRPSGAINARSVAQKPSSVVASRPVGPKEPLFSVSALVRYLFQPGELEGGRPTVWSLKTHTIRNVVRQRGQNTLYYFNDAPTRGFVREELLVVPPGTELPPPLSVYSIPSSSTRRLS